MASLEGWGSAIELHPRGPEAGTTLPRLGDRGDHAVESREGALEDALEGELAFWVMNWVGVKVPASVPTPSMTCVMGMVV